MIIYTLNCNNNNKGNRIQCGNTGGQGRPEDGILNPETCRREITKQTIRFYCLQTVVI
jgi:hypothetical protein